MNPPHDHEARTSSFELSKWYLDCVSDEGDVFIAYAAEVRWRALALRYASTLVQRRGEETRVRATLRGADPPTIKGSHFTWASPSLDASASFSALEHEVSDVVLARDEGHVTWQCHAPRAHAEVELANEAPLRGLGYVEHLTLTIAPWSLPIDELWWGRFLSDDVSLVWIDWRGPHQRQTLFMRGERLGPSIVDARGVSSKSPEIRLDLDDTRVLRQGAIGKTTLAILPAVEAIFPLRILATDETKWVSRGTLHHGDGRSTGYVIHEVVRWPC